MDKSELLKKLQRNKNAIILAFNIAKSNVITMEDENLGEIFAEVSNLVAEISSTLNNVDILQKEIIDEILKKEK